MAIRVEVELKETSQRIVFEDAVNTYTKGPLFVVYADGKAVKFPLANIWRVTENYR